MPQFSSAENRDQQLRGAGDASAENAKVEEQPLGRRRRPGLM